MSSIGRLREYAAAHGIGYTVRRLGEKAGEVLFGTWDRQLRREAASAAESLVRGLEGLLKFG